MVPLKKTSGSYFYTVKHALFFLVYKMLGLLTGSVGGACDS